jgi:putative endonuclease
VIMSDQRGKEHRRQARQRGLWAEILCRCWLRAKGYTIIAQGHVTGRGTGAGEIDIIARRGATVAFIEVKARDTREKALEAVSAGQRYRLAKAAETFLGRHPDLATLSARFDVMVVTPWRWPCHLADAWRPEG